VLGYGVPVGSGLLVGLVAGFVVGSITAALTWSQLRSMRFAGVSGSSDDTWLMSEIEVRELQDLSERDLGAIDAVQPVVESVTAAGRTIQLLSVEWHRKGLLGIFVLTGSEGAPSLFAAASAQDDLGTSYRSAGDVRSSMNGAVRIDVTVVPRPPATARTLTIQIERFIDPDSKPLVGPWTFTVSTRRGA